MRLIQRPACGGQKSSMISFDGYSIIQALGNACHAAPSVTSARYFDQHPETFSFLTPAPFFTSPYLLSKFVSLSQDCLFPRNETSQVLYIFILSKALNSWDKYLPVFLAQSENFSIMTFHFLWQFDWKIVWPLFPIMRICNLYYNSIQGLFPSHPNARHTRHAQLF